MSSASPVTKPGALTSSVICDIYSLNVCSHEVELENQLLS